MLPTKKLMSAMAGLAMMALPMSAMASDHNHYWNHNFANGQSTNSRNFARGPASAQNQFVHNQALGDPITHNQAWPGLKWRRGSAFGTHPNYSWNQSNWQNWGYRQYNNRNWMANNYRQYVVPPSGCGALATPVNPYAAPPGAFAFNQPYMAEQTNCPNANYGYGLGNGYGYANPYLGGYGYRNSYPGGGLMVLRDRLLQERAGAYQQLAIRERNGDRNGAHHLWNTIHSLNQQLSRVNASINQRG